MTPGSHRSRTPPRHGANSRPPSVPAPLAGLIAGCGRVLIGIGVLVLAFAGFQLWGTGLAESRAQEDLTARFRAEHGPAAVEDGSLIAAEPSQIPQTLAATSAAADDSAAPPETAAATDPAVPAGTAARTDPAIAAETAPPTDAGRLLASLRRHRPPPAVGEPVAVLTVPAIGLTKTVVEGTSRDALRSGPGHYRATPLPGRPGNVAIAGHRTTHGAPFLDIDRLVPGDEITMETPDGIFTYLVEGQVDDSGGEIGHRIVDPDDVGVIADQGDDRLTLTACHPKYSARQRIIVTAVLRTDDPTSHLDAVPTTAVTGSQPPPETTAAGDAEVAHTAEPDGTDDPVIAAAAATGPTDPQHPIDRRRTEQAAIAQPPVSQTTPQHAIEQMTAGRPVGGATSALSPVARDEAAMVARSLGWQGHYAGPTLAWAALTALIAAAGWGGGRLWRRFPAWAMAVPPFTLALFTCFANLERLLPAA